jgi:hypothetical protein
VNPLYSGLIEGLSGLSKAEITIKDKKLKKELNGKFNNIVPMKIQLKNYYSTISSAARSRNPGSASSSSSQSCIFPCIASAFGHQSPLNLISLALTGYTSFQVCTQL